MFRARSTSSKIFRILAVLPLAGSLSILPGDLLAGTTEAIEATSPGQRDDVSAFAPDAPERGSLPVPPPVMPGWPQVMGTHPAFSPVGVCLADVDADGDLEVIAGSTNNRVYVWNHDGTLLPGWPVTVAGQIQSKVAAADLDGDGDLEIVFNAKDSQVYVYHHDATPLSGWPQPTGFAYGLLSPSVYDLFDDGSPEILLGGGSSVRAWSADGVPLPGWPQAVSPTLSGTLAIGDVTGDAAPEILAVSTSGELYCFRTDGTQPPGWPAIYGMSSSYAAPSIGDLDGDGDNEACVVGYTIGVQSRIFAFAGDGSAVPGFPVTYPSSQTYSCPVLGDADGDGDLEIFNAGKITGGITFHAWDHTGALLPGWPVLAGANMEGSTIVVDFDGLPGMEAAVADNSGPGWIHGYNLDGSAATDFPIAKPGICGPSSPEVGDVDQDGDLDLALTGWDGSVTLWDLPAAYDEDGIEWGAMFHDDWNTNQHGFVVPGADLTAVQADFPAPGLRLGAAYPNPLRGGSTAVDFALPAGESVRLSVHDASGRLIRLLHDGPLARGAQRGVWDGLNASGHPAAGGIYFLRLEGARSGTATTKVTVIR